MNAKLLQPKLSPTPKTAEVARTDDGNLFVSVNRADYTTFRVASGAGLNRLLQRIGSAKDFLLITPFRGFDRAEGTTPKPRSKSENERLFQAFPAELRGLLGTKRIGAYWLVGHWTECSVNLNGKPMTECTAIGGEIVDNLEYSWFFSRDDESVTSEAWLNTAIALATKYAQDGFIIRVDGETTLRKQNGTVSKVLETDRVIQDAWANLARMRGDANNETGYGYTELRKVRERGRRIPVVMPPAPQSAENAESVAKESAYRLVGNGLPYAPEFFVAVPHSNAGKAIFAAEGIRYHI